MLKATSSSRRISIKDTVYTPGGRAVRANATLNPLRLRARKNEEHEDERLRLQSESQESGIYM